MGEKLGKLGIRQKVIEQQFFKCIFIVSEYYRCPSPPFFPQIIHIAEFSLIPRLGQGNKEKQTNK